MHPSLLTSGAKDSAGKAGSRETVISPVAGGVCVGGIAAVGCAGAEHTCFETDVETTQQWEYVGPHRGRWESAYQYVGPDLGSYDFRNTETIRAYRCRWCCIILMLLISLLTGGLLLYFMLGAQDSQKEEVQRVAPPTHSALFDCQTDYWNWEKAWMPNKKHWCCQHHQRGCEVATTSLPFDCHAAYNNWEKAWSDSKKAYCCAKMGYGCPATEPFECNVGSASSWRLSKKAWCCDHHHVGCPVQKTTSLPYDCQAGAANWKEGWSAGKKEWCCAAFQVGCAPYDCNAGFEQWEVSWSKQKQIYCCDHAQRGCTTTTSLAYDCNAGFSRWETGWSDEKKSWCCQHGGRACGAYDCNEGFSNWQESWSNLKQSWCCAHQKRGCPIKKEVVPFSYDCNAGYSNRQAGWSDSKKTWCCKTLQRGCPEKYDCKAGAEHWIAGWSDNKKSWCCSHANLGCAVAQYAPDRKSCKIWGDPHIITFDETHFVWYRGGDFSILKTDTLQIQGRFQATEWTKKHDQTDFSSMTGIAIGGSALGNHRIEIFPLEDTSVITCDKTPMLKDFGLTSCGKMTMRYDSSGRLIDSAMSSLEHRVLHMSLPEHNFSMQVNVWPNFMNAEIKMRPVVGQDGVCGNANSNRADDSGLLVHRRFGTGVPAAESLFSHPIPLHVPAATVPEKKCSKEKRLRAEAICRKEIHSLWGLEECVADICVDHGTVSEPQTYDCLAGFAHRRMGWSDDKKRWCCVAHNKGCEQ